MALTCVNFTVNAVWVIFEKRREVILCCRRKAVQRAIKTQHRNLLKNKEKESSSEFEYDDPPHGTAVFQDSLDLNNVRNIPSALNLPNDLEGNSISSPKVANNEEPTIIGIDLESPRGDSHLTNIGTKIDQGKP